MIIQEPDSDDVLPFPFIALYDRQRSALIITPRTGIKKHKYPGYILTKYVVIKCSFTSTLHLSSVVTVFRSLLSYCAVDYGLSCVASCSGHPSRCFGGHTPLLSDRYSCRYTVGMCIAVSAAKGHVRVSVRAIAAGTARACRLPEFYNSSSYFNSPTDWMSCRAASGMKRVCRLSWNGFPDMSMFKATVASCRASCWLVSSLMRTLT